MTEWLAYAQVGVRPYLRGDLWGYYGNACGDADSNGVNETVNALTFDLGLAALHHGQARAFGSHPHAVEQPLEHPALPHPLLGSDRLERHPADDQRPRGHHRRLRCRPTAR